MGPHPPMYFTPREKFSYMYLNMFALDLYHIIEYSLSRRLILTMFCILPFAVPKSLRMSRDSSERNVSGVDPMEHYKHIISELLLRQEDTFSTGDMKHVKGFMAQNNGKVGQKSLPLFTQEIRSLSKCDMERLKHVLHDVFTILNDDVDEVKS